MLKGIILSSGILILIFCYFYFFTVSKEGYDTSGFKEAFGVLLIVTLPVLAAGSLIGYFAEHWTLSADMSRFMQIFLFSMCIYLFGAVLIGIFMIFGDGSHSGGFFEKLGGGIALGGMGALIFAVIFTPVIAVLSGILSRWTG